MIDPGKRTAVYKYPLEMDEGQIVLMPKGSKVLHVHEQRGRICLWALVNPDEKDEEARSISVRGTGRSMTENPGTYLGTVHVAIGVYVFHVWEVGA